MKRLNRCLALCAALFLCGALATGVSAVSHYPTYTVTEDGLLTKVPSPYEPVGLFPLKPDGDEETATGVADLYVYADNLFVVLSEGGKVLKMDSSGRVLMELGAGELNKPKGCFVDAAGIYVADTDNGRIAVYGHDGKFVREIKRPDSPLLEEDFVFLPEKLAVDDRGYFCVVCKGNENGLLLIDAGGEFRGYFGANLTQVNLFDQIIRALYSKEDRGGKNVKLPFSYINIDIKDSYIYTSTTGKEIDQIRRLGPTGSDALFDGAHIDFNDRWIMQNGKYQNFVDFAVDGDGNLIVLDDTYCKIVQYDKNGKMLFAFGDKGVRRGGLQRPVSIAVDGASNLYVADAESDTIQKYAPTAFALAVNRASACYNKGAYDEALNLWEDVLRVNSQYTLARQSMGYIRMRQEDYAGAMEMFYQANDPAGYSEAFAEQRDVIVSKWFPLFAGVAAALIASFFIWKAVAARRRRRHPAPAEGPTGGVWDRKNILAIGWRSMFHPFDTFSEMKYKGKGRYSHAAVLVLLYMLVRIVCVFCTSFMYRHTPIAYTDWTYEILMAVAPWFLLSLANYGVCTLGDGEGKFREVFVAGAYCLTPFIVFSIPAALLTNVLSLEESGFLAIFHGVLFLLCGFMAFALHTEIHNLSVGKTIFIALLTVAGALVVGYLLVIVYGLSLQLWDFLTQIVREVRILAG